MPHYLPITRERHSQKYWLRPSSYAFATTCSVVQLVGAEMPKLATVMPIGFVEQMGGFVPVAVLGLQPGKNLFVASDGRWIGSYIPVAFRSHPFRLSEPETGQQALCIDEESGLLSDGPIGERFFTEAGEASQATLDVLSFLTQSERNRLVTAAACGVMQKHKLFCPWPITLKAGDAERALRGLFQVDEVALNQLPGEALIEVHQAGVLPMAYCQLLSMQHLPLLGRLSDAHAKAAEKPGALRKQAAGSGLDDALFTRNETISFAGLG